MRSESRGKVMFTVFGSALLVPVKLALSVTPEPQVLATCTFTPMDGAAHDDSRPSATQEAEKERPKRPDWQDRWPVRCSWFGRGAIWIDDVNGDDVRDVLIPDSDCRALFRKKETGDVADSWSGGLFVVSGSDGALLGRVDRPDSAGNFGRYLAEVGDVGEGSGREVLVYSLRREEGESAGSGPDAQLHCISPATGKILYTLDDLPVTSLRNGLVGLGDLDGDDVADALILGETWHLVVSAGKGEIIRSEVEGGVVQHRYRDAASLPDVDRDGVPDYLVSLSKKNRNGAAEPIVAVISGADGRCVGVLEPPRIGDQSGFGDSLAVGDVVGDRELEVVVGSPGWRSGGAASLHVFDLSEQARVLTITPPAALPEPVDAGYFGMEVCVLARIETRRSGAEDSRASDAGLIVVSDEYRTFRGGVLAIAPSDMELRWEGYGPMRGEFELDAHYGAYIELDKNSAAPKLAGLIVGTANGQLATDNLIEVLEPRTGERRFFVTRSAVYAAIASTDG